MFNQELSAARQRLQQAQDVQQRRLNQEAQEKSDIAEAARQVVVIEKQKAAADFQAATAENKALHARNQQAVSEFRAALERCLSGFKNLLATLPDTAVQQTFEAGQNQARGAVGLLQRQMIAEYTTAHPEQDGREAAIQAVFQSLEAMRVLHSTWPVESVLGAFVRDSVNEMERRARTGIVYALYGGELSLPPESTDAAIQMQLDSTMHDRLNGR